MTQPREMRGRYIGSGPPEVDGDDLWRLITACTDGELAIVQELIARDANLQNAAYWYETPIHYAVREGHVAVVRALLDADANPARSAFCYRSWPDLLRATETRGLDDMQALLVAAMRERFAYDPAFATLAAAIRAFDPAAVSQVLAAQPELSQMADAHGNGPIHWAILTHQLELLPALIAAGADLDAERADGARPIHIAITGNYHYRAGREIPAERRRSAADLVQAMLDHGAAPTLGVIAWRGDLAAVQALLAADPGAASRLDGGGTSPLAFAALAGRTDCVRALLDAGADLNMPETLTARGRAVFEAAAANDLATATLLLKHGADPNAEIDSSGNPLSIVGYRHPDDCAAMQALLRHYGARDGLWNLSTDDFKRLYAADELPQSSVMGVSDILNICDVEAIEMILAREPGFARDLYARDFRTPSIQFTAKLPVLQRLLAAGLDVNRRDWRAVSILHYAAQFGDLAVGEWLIAQGAAIDAEELEFGYTPLGYAVHYGQVEFAKMLLAKGADPLAPADRAWAQAAALAATKPAFNGVFS